MYLTKRQKETFDFIADFVRSNGYAPTLEEIGEHFGLSSPATVYKHVQQLVSKGFLRKTRHQGRGLEIVDTKTGPAFEAPVLGEITVGRPVEAPAQTEVVELPRGFSSTAPVYLLRVRGTTFEDELLADGDLVVIEDRPSARDGEVVLALLHGQVSAIGRYYSEPSHARLEPLREGREPLYVPEGQLQIRGVILGTLRTFR
jgi:repressor LexA